MARKAKKKEEDIEAYRHEAETRKNAVPVGLASYDTSKPKPKKYDYDPHLDPQLAKMKLWLSLRSRVMNPNRTGKRELRPSDG